MPAIIPIRDLRDTSRVSTLCHETNEPIFITKNGYGDMVLMSMDVYENQFSRLAIRDAVMKGKQNADAGHVQDGNMVMERLSQKYAL